MNFDLWKEKHEDIVYNYKLEIKWKLTKYKNFRVTKEKMEILVMLLRNSKYFL